MLYFHFYSGMDQKFSTSLNITLILFIAPGTHTTFRQLVVFPGDLLPLNCQHEVVAKAVITYISRILMIDLGVNKILERMAEVCRSDKRPQYSSNQPA